MSADPTAAGEGIGRVEAMIADRLADLRAGRFAEEPLTSGEIDTVAQQLLEILKAETTHDGATS